MEQTMEESSENGRWHVGGVEAVLPVVFHCCLSPRLTSGLTTWHTAAWSEVVCYPYHQVLVQVHHWAFSARRTNSVSKALEKSKNITLNPHMGFVAYPGAYKLCEAGGWRHPPCQCHPGKQVASKIHRQMCLFGETGSIARKVWGLAAGSKR